jgi:hypothetical protein
MSLEPMLARIAQIESAIADPGSLVAAGSTAAPSASSTTATTATPTATAASAQTSFASLLSSASAPTETSSSPLADAETMDSIYGMDALQYLGGDQGDDSDSSTLDPASELLSLVGTGALPSSTSSATLAGLGSSDTLDSVAATGLDGSQSGSGNQAIVQIAESQVGQIEQPVGSNNGPAITMYRTAVAGAEPGEPWCAQFASWVAKQAGTPLGDEGQGFSAVSQIWSWAQQTGRAIPNGPGVVPQPGDLIVFGDQHVGIVTGVQPNGDIDTVEGNYDNQVVNNVRSPDEATGYVNMSE